MTKSAFPVARATSSSVALFPLPAGPSRRSGRPWHSANAVASRLRRALRVSIIGRKPREAADVEEDVASPPSRRRSSTPPTRTYPGAAGRSHQGRGSSSSSSSSDLPGPGSRNAAARSSATAASISSHASAKAWRCSGVVACRARSRAAASAGRPSVRSSAMETVQRISGSGWRRNRTSGVRSQ